MQYEAKDQQTIIEYCDYKRIPIFHIANGGKRDPKEAYFLKRIGVRKGVPDLCVPVAVRGYHGLYIELKHGKNKPTEDQEKWIELLTEQGYLARVCYGVDETVKLLEWYFKPCTEPLSAFRG